MTERKYPFVVGNDSRESVIENALEGLRLMAEMGRKAQEALDGLERDGKWLEPVFWADVNRYNAKEWPKLKKSRFQSYREISPDDLPGMADAYLDLGKGDRTSYGGHPCVEYPLTLVANGLRDVLTKAGKKRIIQSEVREHMGSLRVSKRTISLLDHSSAYKLTTKSNSVETMVARVKRAEDAIDLLATKAGHGMISKDSSTWSQRGLDMYKKAPDWMKEGGHALRMLEQAIRDLHIKWIMDE